MPRYVRNTVVVAKVETTTGVDAVPTGAANAILVTEVAITPLDAKNVDRNVIRGYFGASEQLVGVASVKLSITIELAGSGAAATAPAMSALFQGCAMAEALLTTPNRVEYTPVSTGFKSLTIYYFDDGVLHKMVGAMGTFSLSAKVGERPTLKFEFTGLDGAMSVATTVGNYSAWRPPVTMTRANVVDITFGATYAAGVLSGGTVFPSTGLELALGNEVNFSALLSAERVDITDRKTTGSLSLDLTAAQEVAFMASVKANTLQSLALTIGTVSGSKLIIHAPTIQLINPKKDDLNGTRLGGYDLRAVPTPTGTGNDELRLAFV